MDAEKIKKAIQKCLREEAPLISISASSDAKRALLHFFQNERIETDENEIKLLEQTEEGGWLHCAFEVAGMPVKTKSFRPKSRSDWRHFFDMEAEPEKKKPSNLAANGASCRIVQIDAWNGLGLYAVPEIEIAKLGLERLAQKDIGEEDFEELIEKLEAYKIEDFLYIRND